MRMQRDNPATFDEVVLAYICDFRQGAKAEVDFYTALPSLAEAKRRAGRAERPDGKRHDHQRRLTPHALGGATEQLARLPVRRCKTFDELHALLEETIGSVGGVGPVMVYDTAVRVGAQLGLSPRHVYLHAGVREGAAALGLGVGVDRLRKRDLPNEFQRLAAREIEDCLCIYKEDLARIMNRQVNKGPGKTKS
jgi:hypothetical protein